MWGALLCLSILSVEATVQFVAGGSSNWTYYDDALHTWVTGSPTNLFNIWADVVYSPALDLWVGAGFGVPDLVVSPDGITWQSVVLAQVNSCVGVCEGGGVLVAVCNPTSPSGSSLYRSVDRGVTWIGVGPSGLFVNNMVDGGRCSFSPSQNRFIAAGVGTATLAFSDNLGANWTSLGNIVFDVAAHSVAWSEEQVRHILSIPTPDPELTPFYCSPTGLQLASPLRQQRCQQQAFPVGYRRRPASRRMVIVSYTGLVFGLELVQE